MAKRLIFFDTTLRDGEQAPGATMTLHEKVAVAKVLDRMHIDVIEAGFAAASDGDAESISQIAQVLQYSKVCSLSRAVEGDIRKAASAVKNCKQGGRIHTFISTSPLHMEFKLKMNKDQVLAKIKESVSLARSLCDDVEWSAEDATRTELGFLYQCVDAAISAGAKTINLPDTVGYATPDEIRNMVTCVHNSVANIDKATISVHCHNDLGLAASNTLSGISAGAGQVELTINGIGERAGNAAFEEVIMAIKTRNDVFRNVDVSHINTKYICEASELVSNVTGFIVQNNKPIVGANAFAHESGIHQDGILKNRATYEILNQESIGVPKKSIVLGKHSGRNAVKTYIVDLGITFDDKAFEEFFLNFKALCDAKKHISDSDIIALAHGTEISKDAKLKIVDLDVKSGIASSASASIIIAMQNENKAGSANGNGPVDAIFSAIDAALSLQSITLDLYQVHSIAGGSDAVGSVTVRVKRDGKIYTGHGSSTDILIASAEGYVDAINKAGIV